MLNLKIRNLKLTWFRKFKEVDWNRIFTLWMAFKNLPLNFFNDNMTQEFFKRLEI